MAKTTGEEAKKNILFIANGNSYIVSSLTSQLRNNPGMKVTSLGISEFDPRILEETPQAILLYAPDDQKLNTDFLENLRNYLIEYDLTLFSLGETNNLNKLAAELEQCDQEQFTHPYKVMEITNRVIECSKGSQKTVLVVDDSGVVLRKMKGWLEPRYKTILANSGMAALKCLSRSCPDLILLDYEMPVCDGKQVLEMIRSESEFSEIPVIFLTNRNDKESVYSVMELKPENYLLKTMEKEDILKVISDFFKKQKDKKAI